MSLCDGVDLNRNFGYQWKSAKTLSPQAGSSQTCMETYAGPTPFSEPEARNIANFVSSIQQNVVVSLVVLFSKSDFENTKEIFLNYEVFSWLTKSVLCLDQKTHSKPCYKPSVILVHIFTELPNAA